MEVLFAQRFVLRQSENPDLHPYRAVLDGIIKKVRDFLWTRITKGAFATEGDTTVRDLYERFYKKLVLRDRSLPRPWVFTTNYDHFSELAMDRLGIPYANGFSGVVERRFNPAIFRYALAEQLDVASRKWTAVDAFVYLCKLHGSVTWTEDDHGLFPIKEVWPPESTNQMLIYPTPAKQNSSLGSPYADLFREFQSRIVREQSVLITAGYAFGDEHLNNIIYQALTIPTFRLVIFAAPDMGGEIAKLRALRDPRIWIIGGDGPAEGTRAHYFDMIVEHFMPQRPSDGSMTPFARFCPNWRRKGTTRRRMARHEPRRSQARDRQGGLGRGRPLCRGDARRHRQLHGRWLRRRALCGAAGIVPDDSVAVGICRGRGCWPA